MMILTTTFLGFFILFCLLGLFSNSYAANYMRNRFDLSKTIYKTLLRCCLINAVGFLASVITGLYLLNGNSNTFMCILFHISLDSPYFIVQSFMIKISILRCLMRCSKKSEEELTNFQKTAAAIMTLLPFAYLGTFYTFRLANDESLGLSHLVSIKVIIKDDIFVEQEITTRYLLRFFDCLAHPKLSATFATDQK